MAGGKMGSPIFPPAIFLSDGAWPRNREEAQGREVVTSPAPGL
jgi:hypothetical protein